MGIILFYSPQHSWNGETECSSLPFVDGFRNCLLTAIVVEERVRSLIASARWQQSQRFALRNCCRIVHRIANHFLWLTAMTKVSVPQYLSMSIPTVYTPHCSSNSASDRSLLPHIDRYPNGLCTVIVEWHLALLITSAHHWVSHQFARRNACWIESRNAHHFHLSTDVTMACLPQLSLKSVSDHLSLLLVDGYQRFACCNARWIVRRIAYRFHSSTAIPTVCTQQLSSNSVSDC